MFGTRLLVVMEIRSPLKIGCGSCKVEISHTSLRASTKRFLVRFDGEVFRGGGARHTRGIEKGSMNVGR